MRVVMNDDKYKNKNPVNFLFIHTTQSEKRKQKRGVGKRVWG